MKSVTPENVNALDSDGMTRLYRLCWLCCDDDNDDFVNRIKWLIGIGANVNLGRIEGKIRSTPLWLASTRGFDKILTTLIEAGARHEAEVDTLSGTLPIHEAATKTHLPCLLLLIEAFPTSVLLVDEYGRTALHRAAAVGCFDCCRALLMAGSRLDASDNASLLPIHYSNEAHISRLLMDFGSSGPTGKAYWKTPNVIAATKKRTLFRATSVAMLELRRRRALGIGRNGRDVLRIVAQFIWSQRRLKMTF